MKSLLVSLLFGTAAVVMLRETQAHRYRRVVVTRARQQVGLASVDEPTTRRLRDVPNFNLIAAGGVLAVCASLVVGPFGLLVGAIPIMVHRSLISRRARKRRDLLADQLGPALQLIIGHLRIGRNVVAAISEVADDTPAPLGDLFREIVSEVRLGASVDEVLMSVAEQEDDRHLNVVASAIGLQSRHGGSLVEILETVVETVEEEDRLRRDVRSLTADGRLSAQVLLAMPPAMLVIVSLLSPGYASPLLEHPTGRAMSVAGLVLGFVGWRWLRALTTPKVVA